MLITMFSRISFPRKPNPSSRQEKGISLPRRTPR